MGDVIGEFRYIASGLKGYLILVDLFLFNWLDEMWFIDGEENQEMRRLKL